MKRHTTMLAVAASLISIGSPAAAQSTSTKEQRKEAAADLSKCARPSYPIESIRKNQFGKVTLEYLIGADGTVKDAKVLRSSGHPLLDQAALEGIKACPFTPASEGGKAIEAPMHIQYVWRLESKSPGDMVQLVAKYRVEAARGDTDAEYELGMAYLSGAGGTKRNPAEAVRLLELAAGKGYVRAQASLGRIFFMGDAGNRDTTMAASWFRRAAEQGDTQSQAVLGMMLMRGEGVRPDDAEAAVWLEKAALSGDANAQTGLGVLKQRSGGEGAAAESFLWLNKAAEQGFVPAQASVGKAYESGEGVGKDLAKAASWYAKAAGKGHYEARMALAGLYERGEGVAMDKDKARELYEAAAKSRAR